MYFTEFKFLFIISSTSTTSSRRPLMVMCRKIHGAEKSRKYLLAIEKLCIAVNSLQTPSTVDGNWPGMSHIASTPIGSVDLSDTWATCSQIMYRTSSFMDSRVAMLLSRGNSWQLRRFYSRADEEEEWMVGVSTKWLPGLQLMITSMWSRTFRFRVRIVLISPLKSQLRHRKWQSWYSIEDITGFVVFS